MIHRLLVQLVEDVANIPGQLFFFYLQAQVIYFQTLISPSHKNKIKVLSETKRTIGFVLFKNVFQLWCKAHLGSSCVLKFCSAFFEHHMNAWFHVIMCSIYGSVKKHQNHIVQNFHTPKDLRKSAFANLWPNILFR